MRKKEIHNIKQSTQPICLTYIKLILASLLAFLSVGLIGHTIITTIFNKVYYRMEEIIFTFFIIALSCFFGCLLLCSIFQHIKQKHRIKVCCFTLIFIYYCFLLIDLLFLSRGYRYISPSIHGLWERIRYNSNLIPFRTINNYLFNHEHDELRVRITNLLGNLLAFMPMAFFLPTYFKRLKKALPYAFCMTLIIVMVELIQGITFVGFMDIDDLILNLSGTMIAFFLCKFKLIQNIERRIMS